MVDVSACSMTLLGDPADHIQDPLQDLDLGLVHAPGLALAADQGRVPGHAPKLALEADQDLAHHLAHEAVLIQETDGQGSLDQNLALNPDPVQDCDPSQNPDPGLSPDLNPSQNPSLDLSLDHDPNQRRNRNPGHDHRVTASLLLMISHPVDLVPRPQKQRKKRTIRISMYNNYKKYGID